MVKSQMIQQLSVKGRIENTQNSGRSRAGNGRNFRKIEKKNKKIFKKHLQF